MPSVAPTIAKRADTADRRRKAIEMRIAGHHWQDIADTLHYASKGAAHTDVTRALEQAVAELAIPLEGYRQLELDRLDTMQTALWPKVLSGDTKAIDTTLRLMDRRAKLLGLDAPQRMEVVTLDAVDAAIADLTRQLADRREAGEASAPA